MAKYALVFTCLLFALSNVRAHRHFNMYDAGVTEDVNASRPCGHHIIRRLNNCCTMPRLVPIEVLQGCFASVCGGGSAWGGRGGQGGGLGLWILGGGSGTWVQGRGSGPWGQGPGTGTWGTGTGSVPSGGGAPGEGEGLPGAGPPGGTDVETLPLSDGAQNLRSGKNREARQAVAPGGRVAPAGHRGGGHHGGRYGGGRGGGGAYMCAVECVLRNQSMLTTDGSVDAAALADKFVAAANETWQPLVKEAVTNCTAEFAKVDLATLATPVASAGGATCKPGAALMLNCVRRYLALSCPEASTIKTDISCPYQINFLKTCDPFAMGSSSSSRGGSGDGWGGNVGKYAQKGRRHGR